MLGLVAFAAGAVDVFRWVDDDGVVHYSDLPQEGAERIELQEAQTFQAPVTNRGVPASTDEDTEALFEYRSLEITSPTEEQVFWNIANQLDVSLRSSPRLRRGHNVQVFMDGNLAGEKTGTLSSIRVTEVDRGQHVLSASILDADGNNLITSPSVSFMVQQTSTQNPNNPNAPPVASPRPRGP